MATSSQPAPLDLSVLLVPDGYMLVCKARAQGVQIYPCNSGVFGAAHPEALMVTDRGDLIHHFAGPTWQAADGSKVVGTKLQAASPNPAAIPWLLLSGAASGPSDGLLSRVTFIQRLFTMGGNPPSGGCTGGEIPVVYEAEYFFYAPEY